MLGQCCESFSFENLPQVAVLRVGAYKKHCLARSRCFMDEKRGYVEVAYHHRNPAKAREESMSPWAGLDPETRDQCMYPKIVSRAIQKEKAKRSNVSNAHQIHSSFPESKSPLTSRPPYVSEQHESVTFGCAPAEQDRTGLAVLYCCQHIVTQKERSTE